MAWVFVAALPAGVGEARAQSSADAQTVAFEAEFFAAFAPRTALDMVERVPGFSIDEGEERRGFSGAQSNILINGERPASKQNIEDVLGRIPAGDIVRIELIRGAGAGASSTQTMRVNVVRRGGGGEGIWELEMTRARDGRVSPSGEASWSGQRGAFEYGFSAAYDSEHLAVRGDRTDFDALGAVDERRVERVPANEREMRLAGEASFPWAGGALSLNAQISRIELDERERAELFDPADASVGAIRNDLEERDEVGELGVSYRRELGSWRGELGAVINRRQFNSFETSAELDALGALDEGAQQSVRIESGETILRGALRRNLGEAWRVEFGAEVALNTLEQRLALAEDDGSGPAPVILPSANVRVEEERAEGSVMLAGSLGSRWTLEAGTSVETSVLTQSGDANQDTELTYWKPSVQISRALGADDQVRLRFYRDVGQLDFEDFVSAADISSSIVDGGNPDLRPETSWRLELAGDWRFGEDAALGITLYRWWVEDVLDIAPVGPPGDEVDAPGNIGEADVYGARMSLAMPIAMLPGAEVRVDAVAQTSEATDPVTGERRSVSGFDESALVIAFRHDITRLESAWGVEFEREREASSYRLDRIEDEQDADELTLWIETTAFADVKLRAWVSNLNNSEDTRRRLRFDPTRLGAFDGSDERARGEGVTFGVSAGGRF